VVKFIIYILIAVALLGGATKAITWANEEGDIQISIDKSKVIKSIGDGSKKAINMLRNMNSEEEK